MFYLLHSRCFRKISAGDRLRSLFQVIHGPRKQIEPKVAVLLITGEIFKISWPILRELGRVQSSGLKLDIIIDSSSILFNNKKLKKSRGLVLNIVLFWRRSTAALVFRVGVCPEVSLFFPPFPLVPVPNRPTRLRGG